MPVRKAVIPAAGLGTRFLPASKAVPKELVTVVDRPIIQYTVEELLRAGITNICIVSSPGKESLTHHFSSNAKLESALEDKGKTDLLEEVKRLQDMADIYSVMQNQPLGLGHAVWVAREHVEDEPFAVLLPDELMDPAGNLVGEMVETFDDRGACVVAVAQVPREEINLYGSIDVDDQSAETMWVNSVIEKPDPDTAPSDLALIGRYVLEPDIFDVLGKLDPGAGGEIQLTDALNVMAERGRLVAKRYRGRRWDAGTKQGFLEATVALAADHPEFGPDFRNYIRQFA
ncbi:MAG TPA: UTP--glucose-1-phosphate uridylyltransferase [Actinomycetota bacterium]|nr:UTP--glucose-1-phosphate uridylyltransferase [Actinomycetota bacterium]